MYFKHEDNILSVKALNRAPGHNFLFTLYCLSFESWLNLNLQVYLQYIVKCASKWGCDKAGFCWNSSNWIPIKATIFTPIHNLGHHPDPDAMLSCFFILLISTYFILFCRAFVSPLSFHFFVHFLIAWGSEVILSYLNLSSPFGTARSVLSGSILGPLRHCTSPLQSSTLLLFLHLNQRLVQLIHT